MPLGRRAPATQPGVRAGRRWLPRLGRLPAGSHGGRNSRSVPALRSLGPPSGGPLCLGPPPGPRRAPDVGPRAGLGRAPVGRAGLGRAVIAGRRSQGGGRRAAVGAGATAARGSSDRSGDRRSAWAQGARPRPRVTAPVTRARGSSSPREARSLRSRMHCADLGPRGSEPGRRRLAARGGGARPAPGCWGAGQSISPGRPVLGRRPGRSPGVPGDVRVEEPGPPAQAS